VKVPIKRALPLLGGALLALIVLAALVLRVMPPPHRPLEYMIAGTAVTGVALAALFAMLNRKTRTHRNS
jgi:hypothetical protein